jgi:hypothetical protein
MDKTCIEFANNVLQKRNKMDNQEDEKIILENSCSELLINKHLNPYKPNKRLKKAAKRYKRVVNVVSI